MSLCEQNSLKEYPKKKRFRKTVGLLIDMKYEFEAGSSWSILGKQR